MHHEMTSIGAMKQSNDVLFTLWTTVSPIEFCHDCKALIVAFNLSFLIR